MKSMQKNVSQQNSDSSSEKGTSSLFSGITKNVFMLGLVSFLTDFSTDMIYPLLPLFLTSVLKTGELFVGVVEGIAESTASTFKLFSGWISDKLSRRKILVVGGYSLSGLTRPIIAISTAGWHVLVARFFDRVGKGVRTSPRDALIADSADKRYLGKAFGFHRAMDHAGAVVGPLVAVGLLIAFAGNYRLVFWSAFIPAILTVFVLIFGVSEVRGRGEKAVLPTLTLKPFDARFKRFLLIVVLFTLGNSSDAFLLLRAKDLGVTTGIPVLRVVFSWLGVTTALMPILWVVFLWAVLHIVKMLSSMPGGIWSDRIGRRNVIIVGWGVHSLVYLGLALASSAWHIWLLFTVYGIYFGLTEGVEKALVADLVPSELRATAYGVYHFAIGIAALPASVIMGALWEIFDPTVAFSFGALLAFVAMALLFIFLPKRIFFC